jgi:hypothetical protein
MSDNLEITSISDVADALRKHGVETPPLSEETLDDIQQTSEYGVALHGMLGVEPPDALPIHVHPEYLLAMIHEIKYHRHRCRTDTGDPTPR